jgi:protein-S-isoprenylcysteine O-methyltransferase Ste14
MRPVFAGDPLETALFGLTVVVWIAAETVQALHRRANGANRDRYSLLVVRVCLVAGVLLAQWALRGNVALLPSTPVTFGIGLVLMWAGIGLRYWCFRTLGRYFTFSVMTSADQTVITTGPYRFLRHPSYAGILMALGGIGVSFGSWLSLAALVLIPLVGILYRIRVEESALSAALGGAYTSYGSRRKRMIPYIW